MSPSSQQSGEVAVAHRIREHAGCARAALVVAGAEIVDEEEELVALDRAAEGAAKLILREGIDADALIVVLPRVCVQPVVLHVSIGGAMELVGAALEDADDAAAVDVAVIGRGVGGEHMHFFEGLGGGTVRDDVVEGLVHIDAVDGVVVGLGAVAVDVGQVSPTGAALDALHAGGAGCADCAGEIKGKRGKVQAVQGEALNGVGGESAAQSGVVGVEDRRRSRDIDRRRGAAHRKRDIECRRLQNFKIEGRNRIGIESICRDGHLVAANRQKFNSIKASGIGRGRSIDTGAEIVRHDLRAWDNGAAGVGYRAGDGTGDRLRHCCWDTHQHGEHYRERDLNQIFLHRGLTWFIAAKKVCAGLEEAVVGMRVDQFGESVLSACFA